MSGLAAAWCYRDKMGLDARILVLEIVEPNSTKNLRFSGGANSRECVSP
jgi:hypothetical protein